MYNFYVHQEGGNLQHINSVRAKSKSDAIKKMGSPLLVRMRKGQTILCIPSSRLGKLKKSDFNGLVK
jgi:hypothetical protein